MIISEGMVVKQVKEVIDLAGLKIQRINTGCFSVGTGSQKRFIRTAVRGTLDFEGYDNRGRFVGIECKRPKGGKLSEEQKDRIDDINEKGGLATVVTSGDEALFFLQKNNCI